MKHIKSVSTPRFAQNGPDITHKTLTGPVKQALAIAEIGKFEPDNDNDNDNDNNGPIL